MRRILAGSLLFALMALVTSNSFGQRQFGGFGGGGGLFLLLNKSVQEELKITEEQKEKFAARQKETFEKMGGFFKKDISKEDREKLVKEMTEGTQKIIDDVLKPEQIKRLKQIERQQNILASLTNEETAKELKLSEEQLEKIKGIQDEYNKEARGLGFSKDNFKENQEKRAALRKEANEKAVKALTEDQQKTWKEMVGEPFEVKQEPFNFGGFGKGKNTPKKDN